MGLCCSNSKTTEQKDNPNESNNNLEKNEEVIHTNLNENKNLEMRNKVDRGSNYKESNNIGAEVKEDKIVMPHKFDAILSHADSPIDTSSPDKILEQLYLGVFLNRRKKKYWVDKTNKNYFKLFARDLSIAWGDDDNYWTWTNLKETSTSNVMVAVAELKIVAWLDINGKFDVEYLSPSTLYEVLYEVMLTYDGSGWHAPINLRLILPDGKKIEQSTNLEDVVTDEWIKVKVGEFTAFPEKGGKIEFFFSETQFLGFKSGLLVKSVIIQPKSI